MCWELLHCNIQTLHSVKKQYPKGAGVRRNKAGFHTLEVLLFLFGTDFKQGLFMKNESGYTEGKNLKKCTFWQIILIFPTRKILA